MRRTVRMTALGRSCLRVELRGRTNTNLTEKIRHYPRLDHDGQHVYLSSKDDDVDLPSVYLMDLVGAFVRQTVLDTRRARHFHVLQCCVKLANNPNIAK